MESGRCPHCRAILPPPKTCEGCGVTFYRGTGGRTDATYCTGRCAARTRMRRWRERHQETTEGDQ